MVYRLIAFQIPVYKGASEALIGGKEDYVQFNGSNGLGGIDMEPYTSDIDANERVQSQNAVEIIHKLVMEVSLWDYVVVLDIF